MLGVTVHHIVFDGWSCDVLFADLAAAYRAALAGEPVGLGPAAARYADYVAAAARRAQRRAGQDLAWWLDHLAGVPLVLDLPRDAARPPVRAFGAATARAQLSPAASAAVREVARTAGATPFTVLLSAFGLLASRLTGQDDLLVGTPVADRDDPAFASVVGLCLHMLPVRLRADRQAGFADHVRRCRDELTAVLAHPDAELDRIVETLGGQPDLSRNPVFQVLFNGYDLDGPPLDLAGLRCAAEPAGLAGSLFDLTLYAGERDGVFGLQAVYDPALYTSARMEALLASYLELVTGLTDDPGSPAVAASMRPSGGALPDEHDPLPGWSGPGVLARVRAAAAAAPGALAATGPGGPVSYRELAAASDRTAAALRHAGVRPGDTVAVLAARDARLPAVLLGILASGARWLILDPADPRLARQATAAAARALIRFPGTGDPAGNGDPVRDGLPAGAGRPVLDAGRLAASAAGMGEREPAEPGPAEAGYLSLTSGTTGEPRPVLTSDRPLAHFLDWYAAAFGLDARDRFALLSGLAHDPALRDMFTPLVLGGCLCVPARDWARDPAGLAGWLAGEQVTVLHLTPQAARLLAAAAGPAALPRLRLVALGGDAATTADVARLRAVAPGARIVNFYGTTETPQAQAWHDLGPDGVGPAGVADRPLIRARAGRCRSGAASTARSCW